MQQRRKRSKGKLKIQNQGLLASGSPTGEPLASQCIFTKPTGKPAACRLCNLASGSPTGERLASTTRNCAFWPFSQHIKRESWIFSREAGKTRIGTSLGHILELEELEEHWGSLGFKWEAWRDLSFLHLWLYIFFPLLHISSMNSFIVLGFVLFTFMCN